MNPQRAVRSVLAALPLAGLWIFDIAPNPMRPEGKNWLRSPLNSQPLAALGQSPNATAPRTNAITPASDGTGTTVTQEGNRFNIQGGSQSKDGANLFHSFSRFGLDRGQVANFWSNPAIRNILTRVTGGESSFINGLIQVSGGNANLYFMNPAGIIFGSNARLDVAGSFFATTASGIGIGENWFNAAGVNDHATLVGTPNRFFLPSQPGSLLNAGQLAVQSGQSLTLIGGTVVNTGQLSAPGGQITLAAVPGDNVVRLSQTGHLLNLEITHANAIANQPSPLSIIPLSLPELLTGPIADQATGVIANQDGSLQLTGGAVPAVPGTTAITGRIDTTTSGYGGNINILGQRVGLIAAQVDASGGLGGGTVRVGGDYQGTGLVPNAERTYVDRNSTISADALGNGNGGRVIVWADDTASFWGQINARGGTGGFVEVSGKQSLIFRGSADTTGSNSALGTLLLDPFNITIVEGDSASDDPKVTGDSTILSEDGEGSTSFTISTQALESLAENTDLVLEATNDITISDLADNELNFQAKTGSITFRADADRNGAGVFTMNPGDTLSTQGGAISIFGQQITLGNVTANGGAITLNSGTGANPTASGGNGITAGTLSSTHLSGAGGNITLSSNSNISVENLFASGSSQGGTINVSAGGTLRVQQAISNGTQGGNILLNALGDINTQTLDTAGSSRGGDISAISRGGSIIAGNTGAATTEADAPALNSSSSSGISGNIVLDAGLNITTGAIALASETGAIDTQGGGSITLTARGRANISRITAGAGNVAVSAEEIDFTGGNNSISGSGTLTLQPATPGQNIAIGDPTDRGANSLDLTQADLSALRNGFSALKIGRENGSGAVMIANSTTFFDPVVIRAPADLGSIIVAGKLIGTDNASIFLNAGSEIRAGELSTPGAEIRLNSGRGSINVESVQTGGGQAVLNAQNTINLRDLDTSAPGVAGNISIVSGRGITITGQVDSSSESATGGSVTVASQGQVIVEQVDSSGRQGGNVTLTGGNGITAGRINATGQETGGEILLTGSEIDLIGGDNSVSSNGQLVLQSISPGQEITVGSSENTNALNLSPTDLEALHNGFSAITIGRTDGTGVITIAPPSAKGDEIRFRDPTLIQTPAGAILGDGSIAGSGDAAISLYAGEINVGEIAANAGISLTSTQGDIISGPLSTRAENGIAGNIALRSAGGIEIGNANAFGSLGGGNISMSARAAIKAGVINSSSSEGNAGSSVLASQSNIEVTSVKAGSGGAAGGNVEISAGGIFRATGTFTDFNKVKVSISTAGRGRSGKVTIDQGRGSCGESCTPIPFVVGNPDRSGTAGAITDGKYTLSPTQEFGSNVDLRALGNVQQPAGNSGTPDPQLPNSQGSVSGNVDPSPGGNISDPILTDDSASPSSPGSSTQNPGTIQAGQSLLTDSGDSLISSTSQSAGVTRSDQNLTTPQTPTNSVVSELSRNGSLNTGTLLEVALQVEQRRGQEFERYLGGKLPEKPLTAQNIRETLSGISNTTGLKPAVVYVSVRPNQLELQLFLPNGRTVFKSVPISRDKLIQTARELAKDVRSPRSLKLADYKPTAQRLYEWLITPLESELATHKINTLIFSMDAGLRTLPLAALYDGRQFLVEKYSLGLVPSLSLTDTRYVDIRNAQVLAMGASEFPAKYYQNPLPAVPLELSTIVGTIWPGASFLNEAFTLSNLKAQRSQRSYPIIHLATHGEFQPGGADQSYIQFWDTRLGLNQLGELKLYSPPVELLVLSACTTAVGDEEAELGFAGLAVRAGVKSALASLWYVSDAGSLSLMTEFYQQLRTAPIKAEALRQAQLAMLRGQVRLQDGFLHRSGSNKAIPLPAELATRGDRDFSHPYYWAAFTMIGSPW